MAEVAIIGAGVAGTALALTLHQVGVPCRIYETRQPGFDVIASGVSLTPNGLRILDALGVLDRVASRSYQAETMTYKNARDETTEIAESGSRAKYGYAVHRLYRKALFDELTAALGERGVPIEYGARFERVASEAPGEGVVFQLAGGKVVRARMLVGADGLWSSVRKYVAPGCKPEYMGLASVYGHIPTESVAWPSKAYERTATIQDTPGSLFFMPEVPDGSDLMVGRQFAYPDRDRAEWDALAADAEQLAALFRQGYDEWGATARSIIDQVCARKEGILLWPFNKVPRMHRWVSKGGRVLIVGDAAHALPPSSGQGVNQALEDVYSLALLLQRVLPGETTEALTSQGNLASALDFWNEWRQERIEDVVAMANATNIKRLPDADRRKLIEQGKLDGQGDPLKSDEWKMWMFKPDIEGEITSWLQANS